jgi:LysM repeat protein
MSEDQPTGTGRENTPVRPPLRRRPLRQKKVYRPASPLRWVVPAMLVIVAGTAYLFYAQTLPARYAVTLDEKPLYQLDSRESAETALLQVKRRHAPKAPDAVTFKEGAVGIARARGFAAVYSVPSVVKKLDARLTAVINGSVIIVNRRPLVLLASEAEAWKAVSLMQEHAARGKRGVPTVKERLAIRPYQQAEDAKDPLPLMTAEEAAAELAHPPRAQFHTVKRGESFYVIAEQYGTTVDAIKKLNPKLDPGRLDVGDIVRLPDIPAPITIVMRRGEA